MVTVSTWVVSHSAATGLSSRSGGVRVRRKLCCRGGDPAGRRHLRAAAHLIAFVACASLAMALTAALEPWSEQSREPAQAVNLVELMERAADAICICANIVHQDADQSPVALETHFKS